MTSINFFKCYGFYAAVILGFGSAHGQNIGVLPENLRDFGKEAESISGFTDLHNDLIKSWSSKIVKPFRPKQEELRNGYVAAIEKLMIAAQKNGNLDETLAFKKEVEGVRENGRVVAAPTEKGTSSAEIKIAEFREVYHKNLDKIRAEAAEIEAQLTEEFRQSLTALTVKLTKAGEIEQAVLSQKLAASLVPKNDATAAVPAKTTAEAKVAMPVPTTAPKTVFKNLRAITQLFPLGFSVTSGLPETALGKANEILRTKVLNAPVQWILEVESAGDSPLHGNKHYIQSTKVNETVGGREFGIQVKCFYDDDEYLQSRKKGDSVELLGRIAACHLTEGGDWIFEIANAVNSSSDAPSPLDIPLAPTLTINSASFGTGKRIDVKPIIQENVVIERETVWASSKSMGGDPDPGWNKNLKVSFTLGGEKKSLNRGKGSALSFADFYE